MIASSASSSTAFAMSEVASAEKRLFRSPVVNGYALVARSSLLFSFSECAGWTTRYRLPDIALNFHLAHCIRDQKSANVAGPHYEFTAQSTGTLLVLDRASLSLFTSSAPHRAVQNSEASSSSASEWGRQG